MIKYGQCTSRNPVIRAMYKEQKIYVPTKKEPTLKRPQRNKGQDWRSKAVVVDGVKYKSITEAANMLYIQEGHGSSTGLANALRRCAGHYLGHKVAYAPQRV